MQNQVNMNQVTLNVDTSGNSNQPQFIIQGMQGGVVNLAELLNKANHGNTHTTDKTHINTP